MLNIELLDLEKCQSLYLINNIRIRIWTIVGGTIATSLEDYSQQKRWNKIPKDKTEWDSTKLEWINNQKAFEIWFNKALEEQERLKKVPTYNYRDVYKTENNTILIVKVELNKKHIAITANEISLINIKEAKKQNNEMLKEYIADGTFSNDSWGEYKDTLELIDNSLYTDEFKYKNSIYIYESVSCGCLHDKIKKVTNKYDFFINNHLSEKRNVYKEAFNLLTSFPKIDIDEKIKEISKDILTK